MSFSYASRNGAYSDQSHIQQNNHIGGKSLPAVPVIVHKERDEKAVNNTGLPDNLKSGIEDLSGYAMDDVKVHYNSNQPAQLHALAYAKGTDIHLSPGQEQHLPHEAWHVVQQKQGRVRPAVQMKTGTFVNDNTLLEREADAMGSRAVQFRGNMSAFVPSFQTKLSTRENSVIQYFRRDKAGLLVLKVAEFDTHRKAEQMDWANEAGFSETELNTIWEILTWGTSGLAEFTLQEIIDSGQEDIDNLRFYCEAINGELGPTIQLKVLSNLDEAIKQGNWLKKLMATIGDGKLIKSTIPLDAFNKLIEDEIVAQAFLDYYITCKPILQTPTGKEVLAFYELVKTENARISDYTADLPDIRNYHKFEKASLDKLKADKGTKNKPLTLVLLSVFDHNGAMIRKASIDHVIQNTRTNVYVIEGANLEKLIDLQDTGLARIALDHGKDGKITQIMIAGHGSSKLIELGGEDTISTDKGAGQYVTKPNLKTKYDLAFDSKKSGFWTDFFNTALKNMETKDGLDPKILLFACLTDSNEIDLTRPKLKHAIKKGLTETDGNQTNIRKAIKKQYKETGSLASVMRHKIEGIDILGAQATIKSLYTEAVKPTGELGIIPMTDIHEDQKDLYITGTKIDYVRFGKDPEGVLKAVIESWAIDEKDCFSKMEERSKEPANTNNEFIIELLFNLILKYYKMDIITANNFVKTAGMLSGIAGGGAKCRASRLYGDPMVQKHSKEFYPALLNKFKNINPRLVLLEAWMQKNNNARAHFINCLGQSGFNKNNAGPYLEMGLLSTHFNPIFAGNIGSERGRVLLALIFFITESQPDCKKFLLTQAADNNKLPDIISKELRGYNEDLLRNKLGLPVEATLLIGSGIEAKPQKNINTPDHCYVAPMRPVLFEMEPSAQKVSVMENTNPESAELESFDFNRDFIVVGEVKQIADNSNAGIYMIRRDNNTVGYVNSASIKAKD